MDKLDEKQQEKISKFIELSLSLILRGFDEMEMQKRLELVKLLGSMVDIYIKNVYGNIIDLERRIKELEESKKK